MQLDVGWETLMSIVRLAALGLALVATSGAASAQVEKPTYEQALNAVTAGVLAGQCERTEAERYIRFYCEEGEALWYFTIEGRPEHEAYYVAPARPAVQGRLVVPRRDPGMRPDNAPVFSNFGHGTLSPRAASAEERLERSKAQQAWMKDVIEASREDAERMNRPKRDRGRLYPLESS